MNMRNGLSKDLIARVLGGAPKYTVAELEAKFPPRNLGEGVSQQLQEAYLEQYPQ